MVTFLQMAQAVTNLEPSNYWIHESTLAKRLGVSDSELEGFVKCVREGGSGAKSKNTFTPNPMPYNFRINLTDFHTDNILNLHYQDFRCFNTPKANIEGDVGSLFTSARYYFVGTSEGCLSVSLQRELDIARFVVGEHKDLYKVYEKIGERRRKLWRQWIAEERGGEEYTEEDLPVIVDAFAEYFGDAQGLPLLTSELDEAKRKIHDLLVALNVLDAEDDARPILRRSARVSSDGQDMVIDSIPSQRRRHQRDVDTERASSPGEVSASDDSLDVILRENDAEDTPMTQQASKTALMNLVSGEDRIAMYPHVSRIVEQTHGMERNAYDSQASYNFRDARTNYMASQEYENRRARRKIVLERAAKAEKASSATATTAPKRPKMQNAKHNDRKTTQKLIGDQLLEASGRFTNESIAERTTEEFRKKWSIGNIKKSGTNVGKKELDEKKVANAEAVASKKRQSTTYTQTSLEDQIEESAKLETANDLAWKSRDAIAKANQIQKVLTKNYWKSVPPGQFFEELQRVFPRFYSLAVSQMTKSFLLRAATPTCTEENNLGKFLNLVKDIANGKVPNTLSTTQRVDELRRAKATKLDILAEFAKVEDSIYLSVAEEKDAQKHAPMRAVIESFGTEISGHARYQFTEKKDLTTTYTISYTPQVMMTTMTFPMSRDNCLK